MPACKHTDFKVSQVVIKYCPTCDEIIERHRDGGEIHTPATQEEVTQAFSDIRGSIQDVLDHLRGI